MSRDALTSREAGEAPATAPAAVPGNRRQYDSDSILTLALEISAGMLESGAEVHRVEDTAERICAAYGAADAGIFAITNLITATLIMPDGRDCTQTRRIKASRTDLSKIEKLNALSRSICDDPTDPLPVIEQVKEIKRSKSTRPFLMYIGGLLVAAGFTLFFGGTPADAALSVAVGLLICLLDFNRPSGLNQIAYTAVVSGVGTLIIGIISKATAGWLVTFNPAAANIGVIMLLIPGLALGNAFRDLLCGDVVSGSLRMTQSMLTAGSIAGGVAAVLIFLGGEIYGGGDVNPILLVLYGGAGSAGFSLLFAEPPKKIVPAVIGGMIGCACYVAAGRIEIPGVSSVFIASTAGSAACTLYAEILARTMKTPATVFILPALIPLVPGGALYYTMAYLVRGDRGQAASWALDTLFICFGIAIGIILVSLAFQLVSGGGKRKKGKKKAGNAR